MRHFATLFDSRYMPQGLALYESLRKHSSEEFKLNILAMDKECELTLMRLGLPGMVIVSLPLLEKELHLEPVRASRTWAEYCWSMASVLTDFLIEDIPELTYCDADLFFFGDPAPVFTEIGARSIAITPHRFNRKDRVRLERNGRFNVGWLTIKNTDVGRKCLSKWAQQTREWCYYRNEDGKFGDQGYLDSFESDYGAEVCVIQNLGVNLGPWSLGNWPITEGPRVDGTPIVCYHFHETRFHDDGTVFLTGYPLSKDERRLIYDPYVQAVQSMKVCV